MHRLTDKIIASKVAVNSLFSAVLVNNSQIRTWPGRRSQLGQTRMPLMISQVTTIINSSSLLSDLDAGLRVKQPLSPLKGGEGGARAEGVEG